MVINIFWVLSHIYIYTHACKGTYVDTVDVYIHICKGTVVSVHVYNVNIHIYIYIYILLKAIFVRGT